MIAETAYRKLVSALQECVDNAEPLHITLTDDAPTHCDLPAFVSGIEDAATAILGKLNEALTSVKDLHSSHPADLLRSLTACQQGILPALSSYTSCLCSPSTWRDLAELAKKNPQREWGPWVETVQKGIEECRQPLEGALVALVACWSELAEALGIETLRAGPPRIEIGTLVSAGRTDARVEYSDLEEEPAATAAAPPPTGTKRTHFENAERRLSVSNGASEGHEYARRLFANLSDWYKNADKKAQVLLGIDGAFLAFLSRTAFGRPDEVTRMIAVFGFETWILLGLMCAALTASIISAVSCLWSRIYSRSQLNEFWSNLKVDKKDKDSYAPQVMWFFQFITKLDKEYFADRLSRADRRFETRALASQIFELSERVLRKHQWLNWGFTLAAASLILFMTALASYLIRLRYV